MKWRFISVSGIAVAVVTAYFFANPSPGDPQHTGTLTIQSTPNPDSGKAPGTFRRKIQPNVTDQPKQSPTSSKIDQFIQSALADSRLNTTQDQSIGKATSPFVRFDAEGRVQVYIRLRSVRESELDELRVLGVEIELVNQSISIVQGWAPASRLEEIAALRFVERISPPSYSSTKSGSVVTEGDAILRADELRQLGIIGAGVRVGIISDGANNLADSQATGDLPVSVSTFGTCNTRPANLPSCDRGRTCNEGTAMAEIIHDIAPGAGLAVAGVNTSLEFVQRVDELVNVFGADVIVDDLGFFFEPYFADGFIAQGVSGVLDQVVFVSSAGNSADGHYENDYSSMNFQGDDFHNFDTGGGGFTDATMDVTIASGEFMVIVLQWNDPFAGSSNDYDLFLANTAETDLLCPSCASDYAQSGSDDPIEFICYHNSTAATAQGKVALSRWSGQNRRMEMFLLGGQVDEYNTPAGSVFGHSGVPGVVAVGAINADEPGNDDIAFYSSRGPSRIDFPSISIRPKPDVTGIDGVSVTGVGGFPSTFYGTSASAPHVAGVAALLSSLAGTSVTTVKSALISGAVDLGAPGVDSTYGAGRLDALAALMHIDSDADGVLNSMDNCPNSTNSSQTDFDGDSLGDACDPDDDNDGIADAEDRFPLDPDEWADTDHDGVGNNADLDDDGDGLSDVDEVNVYDTNPLRRDTDGDGLNDGEEIQLGLDPLDPTDCPLELCPSYNSPIKLIILLKEKGKI